MNESNAETRGEDSADHELIRAARNLVGAAGDGVAGRRASADGEAVLSILEPMGLPPDVLATALIYPLIRDKILDEKDLQNNNLVDIIDLISGLRQLDRFNLPADWKPGEALAVQQSEALRKMLLAVVSDARLVLVRIAEQLHRMRQSKGLEPAARRQLAVETREIYAALANRLGVWQLKWELEDLAFRALEPDAYQDIATALNEKRVEREAFITKVKALLGHELGLAGVTAEISGRPKHIYSIYRKMLRKERGLDSLYDIRAVRLLVDDVKDCYAALGVVHNLWSYLPGEFDDYIANPKDNDYRSLHTAVVGPEGKTVEVQIRTHDMHNQAELGIAAHWRYKEGGGAPAAFDQKINFLRQLLEPANDGSELLDQIRGEVFEERVYAISPKGDVVELSENATPLDFAYHVHTQVGHRCRGAKVNGRIVPLTYRIKNGDRVEIITGSQAQPSRDWLSPKLGYIAGAKTRAKVRNWFRQLDRDVHLRTGREILDRELSRLSERDIPLDKIATQLKFRDTDSLFVALGSGDTTTAAIATAVQQLRPGDETKQVKKRKLVKPQATRPDDVSVTGIGGLLSTFARCCRPVPPEPIRGYITLGRGVSIHRADCGNFLGLERRHPERVLEVNWGSSEQGRYPVDLTVSAFDRAGLIRDISTILADEHANVTDLTSRTDRQSMQTIMQISIEIQDLPTLSTAMKRLEQLPNVVSVRRNA
jgi:GTP pyrophosphokinase